MKMILIGGFLGSGKTSLILQMARYLAGDPEAPASQVVILENEIGEVSIDDKVLKEVGFEVETMFSGCVCCTMSGELVANVCRIRDRLDPDWIIMEASGVAYPQNIRENLEKTVDMEMCRIFCVADAKRWTRLKRVLEAFIRDQLERADVIFINKTDEVSEEAADQVEESIRGFWKTAKCFRVSAACGISRSVWEEVFAE